MGPLIFQMGRHKGKGMLTHIVKHPETISLKRLSLFTIGIVVGLGLAAAAYQAVALLGVAVTGAETVGELHIGWFLVRALVAYRVARVGAGRVYGLGLRK